MKKIVGLDTLRFLAFLAIFVYHSIDIFPLGYLGVDFFFVLSSFLLTYLAYREKEYTGRFSRKNFFVRRALRIFPLYYLIIAFSFLALPHLSGVLGWSPQLPEEKWLYWLFLSNYEQSDCLFYLKFYWSIAVEEQFYLLFILLSFWFRKNPLLILAILGSLYTGGMIAENFYAIKPYLNTVSHFPNFALGMAAGFLFFDGKNKAYYSELALALSGLMLIFTYQTILFNLVISIFFASMILSVIKYAERFRNASVLVVTEKLGEYTYGLYMYSGIVMTATAMLMPNTARNALFFLNLVLVIAVAMFSFHFYEKHFLKLKSKFRAK